MEPIKLEEALKLEKKIFIDVRSPLEFATDHIMGAINIPILDNEERAIIGTLYKHEGKDKAVETGLDFVAPKLKELFNQVKKLKEEYTNVIIYCFRGGMRSSSVVSILSSFGIETVKLDGGYKYYRNYVINTLENIDKHFKFVVLHGNTCIGKTEMLLDLQSRGMGIIDLEYYARNSGSVFGEIYYNGENSTQKFFETQIFDYLEKAKLENKYYLFMESESKKIGKCMLSNVFWNMMKDGYHILVEASIESRSHRCVKDYLAKCKDDNTRFKNSLIKLKDTIGKANIEMLLEKVDQNEDYFIAKFLMENYYDQLYNHSQTQYDYEFTVNSDNITLACDKIELWYKNLINKDLVSEDCKEN